MMDFFHSGFNFNFIKSNCLEEKEEEQFLMENEYTSERSSLLKEILCSYGFSLKGDDQPSLCFECYVRNCLEQNERLMRIEELANYIRSYDLYNNHHNLKLMQDKDLVKFFLSRSTDQELFFSFCFNSNNECKHCEIGYQCNDQDSSEEDDMSDNINSCHQE